MSLVKASGAIIIYVSCKNRWFDKYQMKLMLDFKKFKYCQPKFNVNVWYQENAYYRVQVFNNKKYNMKFNFCS